MVPRSLIIRCFFPLFVLSSQTARRDVCLCGIIPSWGCLLYTSAHCCSDCNRRGRFSFPFGLHTRPSEGRCWLLSDEGRKAAQGLVLFLMTCFCWIYLQIFSALTEWILFGSILALLKGNPFHKLWCVLLLFCWGHREKSAPEIC